MEILFKENEVYAMEDGKKVGYLQYEEDGKLWQASHTVVDTAYGGRGIAGKLVDKLADEARLRDKKIYPICSYVAKKFDQDPKYKDLDAR